jgi:hypothetical protein
MATVEAAGSSRRKVPCKVVRWSSIGQAARANAGPPLHADRDSHRVARPTGTDRTKLARLVAYLTVTKSL